MSNNILMMDNRQLIPRWHTSRKLHKFNHPFGGSPDKKEPFVEDYWFTQSVKAWNAEQTIANAVDVFVRFIQVDERQHSLYSDIHRWLLDRYKLLPSAVQQIVCPDLQLFDKTQSYTTESGQVRLIIHKLKNTLQYNPRDALSWMDLGFYYSIIKETDKALHCVEVAKNLTPDHPFVARSYARFLVHMDMPEQAAYFLKRRPNLNSNPLLLSAFTAITSAFELRNPKIKQAINFIDGWRGEGIQISELAACIGTVEFQNGSVKNAKRHLQTALLSPSENVLSHVQWLHHKHKLNLKNMPQSSSTIEGGINALYRSKKFDECRNKLIEMHQFQPYSSGPVVDAGYLSLAALEDAEFVVKLSDKRMPHTHMHFGELNNLIVAKLILKQTDGLDVDLRLLAKRVDKDDIHSVAIFNATAGMALMENGMIKEGIDSYEYSISLLNKKDSGRALCLAKHFYARELSKFDPQKAEIIKREAIKLAKQHGVLELIN